MPPFRYGEFPVITSSETLREDRASSWHPGGGKQHWPEVHLIAAVGTLTFVSVCWCDFVWDDTFCIVKNPRIRRLADIGSFFGSEYWQIDHPLKGGDVPSVAHGLLRPRIRALG